MTQNAFSRTELLFGHEAMERLYASHVAVFGLGGVGSYAAESLARCGVGALSLIDSDSVSVTNINRQLAAAVDTVGQLKTAVMGRRILTVNPLAKLHLYPVFYNEETAGMFSLSSFDYIIDAIDTVSSKLLLIENARRCETPIISAMGAGNKLDPSKFRAADIKDTSVCPLARVMRKELKKRGVTELRVVYSTEPPHPHADGQVFSEALPAGRRHAPGSTPFAPAVAGLLLASEAALYLAGVKAQDQ